MRIWDLSPGYLNRQSLLGEHRELHGIHNILVRGKAGYARHPETLRWKKALSGLACRHRLLAAEMHLRGYVDRTPLQARTRASRPQTFVTDPGDQITLLHQKYLGREPGRIPLPRTPLELWVQHKYSVMARSPKAGRAIGRAIARVYARASLAELARELVMILRETPDRSCLATAVEHMWGHVRSAASAEDSALAGRGCREMFERTRMLAMKTRDPRLLKSTALGELAVFIDGAAR